MYKAADLRERTLDDLKELERTLAKEIFSARFKNFTNRLDDTSSLRKNRRDLARIKTVLLEKIRVSTAAVPAPKPAAKKEEKPAAKKAAAAAPVAPPSKPAAEAAAPEAPPSKAAPKKKAAAAPKKKTSAKKSEE
jgi:large subunit ribosomal protein L29